MKSLGIVILVVAFVISVVVVNAVYRAYMKLLDADVMLYSRKKKLIAIVVVWLIIAGFILKLFGIKLQINV